MSNSFLHDTYVIVLRSKLFPSQQVLRATDSFNEANLVGKGNYGRVYIGPKWHKKLLFLKNETGKMWSGTVVAVKRLNDEPGPQFDLECEVRNLVFSQLDFFFLPATIKI